MPRRFHPLVLVGLLAAGAPSGADEPAEADRALYRVHCERCHGARGDGDSEPARLFVGPKPRDFTKGLFKLKSTPGTSAPTDEDLRTVIRDGVPGTSMPYFRDLLTPAEIDRLIAVVRSFHPGAAPPARLDLGPLSPDTSEARLRGAAVYRASGCDRCHGSQGRGDGPAAPTLKNDDGSAAFATDLTRPWRLRGGESAPALALRIAVGMPGTPMPAFALRREQLWDLVHYLRSLGAGRTLRAEVLEEAKRPPGDGVDLATRGAYLVRSSACHTCHTPVGSDLKYRWDDYLGGGMQVNVEAYGAWYSRNLTPDPETGLGTWSAADLRRVFANGVSASGRRLSPLCMPWHLLGEVQERDVDAIFAYLQTLEPVKNLVPPPESRGFFATVVRKASILAGARPDERLHFSEGGNRGRPPQPGEKIEPVRNPRRHLAAMGVFAAGALLYLLCWWRRRGSRWRWLSGLVAYALVASGVTFLYMWPPYGTWVSRETIMAVSQPLPPPVVATDRDQRVIAERGRYVAITGMCAMCHSTMTVLERDTDHRKLSLAGGAKNVLPVAGTVYTANLTSDVASGLGGWTDDELRRALRSGISKGGHVMHHLLMPWVHTANISPEDLEALIVYLRQVLPIYSKVPPRQPPQPGDPDHYVFYMGYAGELHEPPKGARP